MNTCVYSPISNLVFDNILYNQIVVQDLVGVVVYILQIWLSIISYTTEYQEIDGYQHIIHMYRNEKSRSLRPTFFYIENYFPIRTQYS